MRKPTYVEPPHEAMLSVTEAAGMLRCHPNTVRAWVRQGKLRPEYMGEEKVMMLKKADVQALVKPLEQAGVIIKEDKYAFPVVGIGASAGGVDAMTRLLKHLPTDLGLAYVLVSHLEKGQEGTLCEVLQKRTALPVFLMENGMALQPDRLYVCPAATHAAVVKGIFTLRTPDAVTSPSLRPIDAFFTALANEYQNNAIGIVLSGTGADGTEGLRAIRAEDGLTLAQDASALEQGMPQNAQDADVVDLVRSAEDIGKELADIVKQLYPGGQARIPGKHENELRRILHFLHQQRGIDFREYKEATIHRRIIRRMVLSKCRKLSDYSALLHGIPSEVDTLCNDLLINVTSFFRDPLFHRALQQVVLPQLFAQRVQNDPVRIWVPACAGGEEVVSIAITLLEFLGEAAMNTPVQIFSTDLNERTIEKARLGIYKKSALQNVDPERIKRFFTHVDGHYQVIKSIRDMCVFAKHDLLKDPPFSRVDLVSCQNVLIYLENAAQARVLRSFHYALKPGGYLALGKSETVTVAGDIFLQPEREHKVYTKRHSAADRVTLDVRYKPSLPSSSSSVQVAMAPASSGMNADLDRATERILLNRFVPASVVVNKDMEIVRFRGSTSPFLAPTTGKASLSLLKMVRDDLAFELRGLLQKAHKERTPMRKNAIPVRMDNEVRYVGLEVLPVGDSRDQHSLVIFKDEGPVAARSSVPPDGHKWKNLRDERERRILQLEQELQEAREQMRLVAEEAENRNQELQSANEEVISSNEELQSINEELETSKEELQSINEEFATINEELQARNDALLESEARYRKLIDVMPVAVYTCDVNGHVRLFNDAAVRLWGRTPVVGEAQWCGSVGRRNVDGSELPLDRCPMAQAIKEQRAMKDVEVVVVRPNGELRSVLSNPTPLFDAQGRMTGAINMLVDITELKDSQRALSNSEERFKAVFQHSPFGIVLADVEGRLVDANPAYAAMVGWARADLIGKTSVELGITADTKIRRGILEGLHRTGHTRDAEIELRRRDGSSLLVRSNAELVSIGEGRFIISMVEDVSEKRANERRLHDLGGRLDLALDSAELGTWNIDGKVEGMNVDERFKSIFGWKGETISVEQAFSVLHPDDRARVAEAIAATTRPVDTLPYEVEYRVVHPDGSIHWVFAKGRSTFIDGTNGKELLSFDGTVMDITARKLAEEAQRRLAAIVESSDDAIISKDLDGTLTSWNKGAERMFGYTAEEIIGKPHAILFPEDRHQEESLLFDRLKRGERIEHYETVRIHKEGTRVDVALTLSALKDEHGEVIGASKVMRDISEEKRSREIIRAGEERFHLLADNIAQLAWIAEPDGEIHWYNKRWFDYSGTTLDEMRGWGWRKIHHPDHVDAVTAKFKAHIEQEKDWHDTFPIRGADGEYRWFLSRAFPVRDENGKVLRWFGTNTDVTEERAAREELQQSEERFRLLADNMSQMAYTADAVGTITWVNRRWLEYTGLTVDGMNNGGWGTVVDPDHYEAMVDSYAEAARKGDPWEHIFRLRSMQGEYRWFLSRSMPIKNAEGTVERWFGTNTDITEQKLAEEALEESAKHKDHFLATLAHELRNPLAPLKNGLQLMELAPDEPEMMEATRAMMVRQLDHMVRLVDDLMDLSRISRGRIDLVKEDVKLAEVIGTAMEASKPLIESREHRLHVDMSAEELVVNGDAARLTQVVSNLLNNAAKYTPHGGRIDLSVRRQKDQVEISVRDNGIGIDRSAIDRVFDMFAQVDPEQKGQNAGGLGIGLNVVQRLVHMHKGRVEARSEGLGRGSEFVVRLPLVAAVEKPKKTDVMTDDLAALSKRRVLVVDDNEDIALSMSLILKKYGHVVAVANDGEHAVSMAASFQPDVILMDIGMPRMNGYEACAAIRATEHGMRVHIIAVSGWGQEEDRKKSQNAGFDGHVVKPMEKATLERVIAEAKPKA